MNQAVKEALSAGYQLLDLTTLGEFIIVLDRKDESEPFLSRLIPFEVPFICVLD